jgi:hypothetical protein
MTQQQRPATHYYAALLMLYAYYLPESLIGAYLKFYALKFCLNVF